MKSKLFITIFVLISLSACSTQYPNQYPINQPFPNVNGTALSGQEVRIPEDLAEGPVVLLLGYVQDAQFDIDRWLIGLDMTKTEVSVYELPTIQGMFPKMFKTQIDEGMRRGIPKEMWNGVITIYADGDKIQQFTGNENPNNARVILLNNERQIIYFYDRGFAVAALNDLRTHL